MMDSRRTIFNKLTLIVISISLIHVSLAGPLTFGGRGGFGGGGLRRSGLLNKSPLLSNLLRLEARANQAQQKEDPAQLCADLWDFHDLNEAKEDSLETGKPIMVVICQTWCGACTRLKKKIDKNKYVRELADCFNMVSLMGDDIPTPYVEPDLYPDGDYFPRILFISPEGDVNADITNPEAVKQKRNHLYSYWDCESLAISMAQAVRRFLDVSETKLEGNL